MKKKTHHQDPSEQIIVICPHCSGENTIRFHQKSKKLVCIECKKPIWDEQKTSQSTRKLEKENMEKEKPKTPREQYLEIQQGIEQETEMHSPKSSEEKELEDETEELAEAIAEQANADDEEVEIDKQIGEGTKISVTKEQLMQQQEAAAIMKSLDAISRSRVDKHLSNDQKQTLMNLLKQYKEGTIESPAIKVLLEEKGKMSVRYMQLIEQTKKIQMELLENMQKNTTEITKLQGSLESIDRMILDQSSKN